MCVCVCVYICVSICVYHMCVCVNVVVSLSCLTYLGPKSRTGRRRQTKIRSPRHTWLGYHFQGHNDKSHVYVRGVGILWWHPTQLVTTTTTTTTTTSSKLPLPVLLPLVPLHSFVIVTATSFTDTCCASSAVSMLSTSRTTRCVWGFIMYQFSSITDWTEAAGIHSLLRCECSWYEVWILNVTARIFLWLMTGFGGLDKLNRVWTASPLIFFFSSLLHYAPAPMVRGH